MAFDADRDYLFHGWYSDPTWVAPLALQHTPMLTLPALVCCMPAMPHHSTDGSVMVRKLSRAASGHAFAMKLMRVCKPAAPPPGEPAHAAAAVTAMWYDSLTDDLLTGDATGVTRVVAGVTGVAYTVGPTAGAVS